MSNYGMKVSQRGYDVKTADPRNLVFSSKYSTLRVFAQGSGSLTDGSRTVTIAHNLGYVPMFLVHVQDSNNLYPTNLGTKYAIAPLYENNEVSSGIFAWADSTNLYIKAQANAGYIVASPTQFDDMCNKGSSFTQGIVFTGNSPVGGAHSVDSAIRVTGLQLAKSQSFLSAQLFIYVDNDSADGNTVKTTLYGMAEDNTSTFSSDPFGRSNTTATYNHNRSVFIGQYVGFDVANIVSEIIGRSGWVKGNAMGFKILDNASDPTHYFIDDYGVGQDGYLAVLLSNTIANFKYTIFRDKII